MPASPSFCLLYSDERLHRHVKEGNGMHTAHTVNVEIPVTAVDMLVPVGPSKRKKNSNRGSSPKIENFIPCIDRVLS